MKPIRAVTENVTNVNPATDPVGERRRLAFPAAFLVWGFVEVRLADAWIWWPTRVY